MANTHGLNFIKIKGIWIFSGGRSPLLGGMGGGVYMWPVMPIFKLIQEMMIVNMCVKFCDNWLRNEVCRAVTPFEYERTYVRTGRSLYTLRGYNKEKWEGDLCASSQEEWKKKKRGNWMSCQMSSVVRFVAITVLAKFIGVCIFISIAFLEALPNNIVLQR